VKYDDPVLAAPGRSLECLEWDPRFLSKNRRTNKTQRRGCGMTRALSRPIHSKSGDRNGRRK
jgi:hypothetical protein